MDALLKTAFAGKMGVQYDECSYMTGLMFTEDSAIFANLSAETTKTLYAITLAAHPYGLKINPDKTNILSTVS